MSEWFYSPAPGRQEGPLDDRQLARLHLDGALTPDTLVWREGMAAWQPWREVVHTAAMETSVLADAVAGGRQGARVEPTFGVRAPLGPDAGAALPAVAATESPYTPPQARVDQTDGEVVRGGRVVYAGFWRRFAAYCIDYLVTSFISYAMMIPMMMFVGIGALGTSGQELFSSATGIVAVGASYLLVVLMPVLYFAWMHSSKMQATLGKMAVGIKVTRGDGARIGFWRAFGRVFATILSTLILLIGYIMAGFTERKQALHDMVCDTLVVDKWAYTDRPDWQRTGLDTVSIIILCLAGLFILGMLALAVSIGIAGGLGRV